ncbi:MAG: amidohydrolase, partial [Gammaproteobacteria bacterium]|nr:amidohydrolase [Gammaproteobacteria bacterium]
MQNLLLQPERLLVVLSAIVVLSLADSVAQEVQPEQILLHGKVLSVDDDFSIVEAIAIAGDKILAVGSSDDMLALAGPATRIIELEGRTVIPGL